MPIRTYADTSVFGGLHDVEFSKASRRFFDLVQSGRFALATSAVAADKLEGHPSRVSLTLKRSYRKLRWLKSPRRQSSFSGGI